MAKSASTFRPSIAPGQLAQGPTSDWSAYWTLVTGMIVLLFVLYIAGNGQLTSWLNLFLYSAPATASIPASASASSATTAATAPSSASGSSNPMNAIQSAGTAIGVATRLNAIAPALSTFAGFLNGIL